MNDKGENELVESQQPDIETPLSEIEDADLKKLHSYSNYILAIGFFASLVSLISILYIVLGDEHQLDFLNRSISVKLLISILAGINVLGALVTLLRRKRGATLGILYCSLLIMTLNPLALLVAIFGIIALSNPLTNKLFGKNKITHKAIEAEYRTRKRDGRI